MIEAEILPILYIEQKPNSKKARIVGKGITVQFLAGFLQNPEWPVERICYEFNLTPAEVYAAWSHYYDHQVEIDAMIQAELAETARLTASEEQQMQVAKLKNRLTK